MVQNNVKKKYFEEFALNLQRESFTTGYIQQMERGSAHFEGLRLG